ncbi:MAG: NACHT domain-containing protein [Cyanobacteria bacterium J06621_12]
MGIGEFALGVITGLVANTIDHTVSYGALEFFQRRKIERRVEDAVAEVVEPLLPFLANEHIKEYQQELLIQTCVNELQPLAQKPESLFQASLNGQKIFENLYADQDLPREVTDEGLKDIYILLFPRIATLLCKIPAAVKDWENESWTENYRRLDEITAELKALFRKVDNLASNTATEADELLQTVRRTLAQKVAIELDLTGLRSDKPLSGKFDDFFVHPQITTSLRVGDRIDSQKEYETGEAIFSEITVSPRRATTTGVAGAGKSTWSKYLQRKAFSENWQGIAIRVELRNFAQGELISYHQLIRETVGKHLAEEITAEKTRQWIEKQQIIFILDGFDEIPPEKRDAVRQWIKDLDVAVKSCSIIVTSRPLTTDHLDSLGELWTTWDIQPFDKKRIIDYINRWYQHTSLLPDSDRKIDAEALASQWQSDPTIKPLTSNPLLLSTLLMVHHLDGSLPSGRSELYNRYIKGMLGLWDDRRKVSSHKTFLTPNQKWQILRGIAIHMHFQEKDQLDEGEISQQLNKILSNMKLDCSSEDVLETLRERSGLIIGPGIYSFIHKSVGEYLVADAIIQGSQRDESGKKIDRLTLFDRRNDDRWNTVIFLWAGLAPIQDLEDFISSCIDAHSYSLTYGLLYDQYEKVSADFCCNLTQKLIEKISFINHQDAFLVTTNYTALFSKEYDYNIVIKFENSRGIADNNCSRISTLIQKGLENEYISWLDIKKIYEFESYDYIWLALLEYCLDNCDHWSDFLSLELPKKYSIEFWIAYLYERLIDKLVDSEKINKICFATKQSMLAHPKHSHVAVLGLMYKVTELVNKQKKAKQFLDNGINELLGIITEIEATSIQSELDNFVLQWDSYSTYPEHDLHNLDARNVLVSFKKSIKYLLVNSFIEENKINGGLMKIIQELVKNK